LDNLVLTTVPVLYASMGNPGGDRPGPAPSTFSNAVFRTENPSGPGHSPFASSEWTTSAVWYPRHPGTPQSPPRTSSTTQPNSPNPTGFYQLSFRGVFTGIMGTGASAGTVTGELNNLVSGIGGFFTVSNYSTGAGVVEYDVTFGGTLANSPQQLFGEQHSGTV